MVALAFLKETIMKTIKTLSLAIMLVGFTTISQANADEHNLITVYKTPYCGCCGGWAKAVAKAGFSIKVIDLEDLEDIKKQSSVTDELAGCHTAIFGDYILEGHVPLEAIDKLMSEKPDIRRIAAPGMPAGSLGMGYDKDAKYNVYAFSADVTKTPTLFYQAGN